MAIVKQPSNFLFPKINLSLPLQIIIGAILTVSRSAASEQPDSSKTDQNSTQESTPAHQLKDHTIQEVNVVVDKKSDALKSEKKAPAQKKEVKLAQLTLDALAGIEVLSTKQKEILTLAMKLGRDHPDNHYKYGSANLKQGGFDCSGAMYFILKESGFHPPRTSAAQYDWVKKSGHLIKISAEVTSLDNPVFKKLQPGDLLFWSHTYKPTDGRTNGITHVQMYLGREKKDDRPVMIGSSDGRSYRGKRQNGYAVFDFKLPRKSSKQKFVGFGPPPSPQKNKKTHSR